MKPDQVFEYRAFISYSRSDSRVARWLHRSIENYRPPRHLLSRPGGERPLRPLFRDTDELRASSDLGASLREAITRSEFLIVVCSPAAAKSAWVNEEILTFRRHRPGGHILAVIVAGEPNSKTAESDCFPEALRFAVDSGGQPAETDIEPLAADMRPGGDGKRVARLKIIAALLDVKLDLLIQRDAQRKVRVLSGLLLAAILLILVFTWLTVSAVRASKAADEARAVAELRRGESENLIEFMLGDMREKLEPVGRLEVMDGIAERALAYYEEQNQVALDPASLSRRSRALQLLGEVHNLRGELAFAQQAFESAHESTGKLLEQSPNSPGRLFDHAQSEFWLGYLAEQLGDIPRARGHMLSYLELASLLVELDPDDDTSQTELLYAYSNLGTLESRERDWQRAIEAFQGSVSIAEALFEKNQDPAAMRELADSYSWLSTTHMSAMNLDLASAFNRKELDIYHSLVEKDPRNMLDKDRYLTALRSQSTIALAKGDLAGSASTLATAEDLALGMLRIEGENTATIEHTGKIYKDLGALYRARGEPGVARDYLDKCILYGQDLANRATNQVAWQTRILLPCLQLKARLDVNAGDFDGALDLLGRARSQLEALRETTAESLEIQFAKARGQLILGDIQRDLGNPGLAGNHWDAAAVILQPYSEILDPGQVVLLATALARLGATEEAGSTLQKLRSIGYRHPDLMALWTTLHNNTGDQLHSIETSEKPVPVTD